jgi:hypothetical protein
MSDPVLFAMKDLDRAMASLSPEEREQVLKWAVKKFTDSRLMTEDEISSGGIADEKSAQSDDQPGKGKDPSDSQKSGIFYFTQSGRLVVNAKRYIKKIRNDATQYESEE